MSEDMLMDIKETIHIPLEDIEIGLSQFRQQDIRKGIDELALNIKTVGLINAITVCELENGKYELIAGQRRLMAHIELGAETIRANVLAHGLTDDEKRTISMGENITIVSPARVDYIDACTDLYRRYKSIQAVSLKLGLKQATVSKYVNYDQLIPALKKLVDKGIIPIPIGKRAQTAAINESGEIDEEAAVAYAKEMRTMTNEGTKRMVQIARKNPNLSTTQILEEGRKSGNITKFSITIASETNISLEAYAKDEDTKRPDAAVTLIEEGLEEKGYLKTET